MKAHSGWAALVVLGKQGGGLQVVDRDRMELVDPSDASWAKQPYHAAEDLDPGAARKLVERGISAARRIAVRETRRAVERTRQAGHEVAACGVLLGDSLPAWTVDQILAVHFRMHKAEGVLFREALAHAAEACGLRLVAIHEKRLGELAERGLAIPLNELRETIATLGKSVGAPWGKDQKEAALAAMIALSGH